MRKFQVWFSRNTDTNEITAFYVSDITVEENQREMKKWKSRSTQERLRWHCNEEVRPRVANFPISQLYDEETQRRRAQMLCDYMNRIQEAMDQAEKHTIMIDAIKAAPVTP